MNDTDLLRAIATAAHRVPAAVEGGHTTASRSPHRFPPEGETWGRAAVSPSMTPGSTTAAAPPGRGHTQIEHHQEGHR